MDFDELVESREAKVGALVLVFLVVGGLAFEYGLIKLSTAASFNVCGQSIQPGFEGENNALCAYQPRGQGAALLNAPLSTPSGACGYSWGAFATPSQGDVHAATALVFGSCYLGQNGDDLSIGAQTNPVGYSEPFSLPIKVSYYVPAPTSSCSKPPCWQYVTGQVKEYTYTLNIANQGGSSGAWGFKGDTIWFTLYSEVWNQASSIAAPSGSTIQGSVFEAPLYAVVVNAPNSNNLDASTVGHAFTFYAAIGGTQSSTLSGSQAPGSGFNQSLSSVFSPDTRMSQTVYYPVSVIDMTPNCPIAPGAGCSYNNIQLTVKLYTLQVGEYILTNPDRTSLQQTNQPCTGVGCLSEAWASFTSFLGSPFGIGSLLGLGTIGLVVVLIVFAGPTIIALLLLFRRRKDD